MLEVIAGLSFFLHKLADFWVAVALLVVNAILGFVQEYRANAAVTALRAQLRITARVLRDGSWRAIPARELVAGDVVRLRTGDFVPADARVLDGSLMVDQSRLTGESAELARGAEEAVQSGSIVRQGEATARVSATGRRTQFGHTVELVERARPKLHIESVVARLVTWLLVIVGILLAIALGVALAEGVPLAPLLPLLLVLLMSAVPVALPVMFTVSMALGAIEMARRGVLVTRLSAAEDAASVNVLCADKTGTLTVNRLSLVETRPQPGHTEQAIVLAGALASNAANEDPLDLAFLSAARERKLLHGAGETVSFTPFSLATRRTEAVVRTAGGSMRVMKGALRSLAEAAHVDAAKLAELEAQADEGARKGYRVLAVAQAEGQGPLKLIGLAFLSDAPRPDSRRLVEELRALGVSVKMLTGDALPVAQEIGRQVGLAGIVRVPDLRAEPQATDALRMTEDGGGFAEMYPEDKFRVVSGLQDAGHVVAMTGDGVNDAPALRQAEVGIAVEGASDVAKSAASVVLTAPGLGGIVELVKHGRSIYQRILTWIVNKVSRTILKAGFVVVAFLITGRFVISALGMVLLVFMTDFVKIALSTDRVRPSQQPETWNIAPLIRVAVVMGVMMLGEALALLAWGWSRFNLVARDGRLETFTFETLLYFALFSILSIRERRAFWSSRPSGVLAAALALDGLAGVAIGMLGLAELRPLRLGELAAIVGFALLCSLGLNDAVKCAFSAWQRTRGGPHPSRL